MANANKAKGTRWETAIMRFFREQGFYAIKPRQEGFLDVGDIHVEGMFTVQAKDYKDVASGVRAGVEGAAVQRVNAGLPYGVAVVKRARKPVEDAYVVVRLGDFPDLVRAATGKRADSLLTEDKAREERGSSDSR